LGRHWVELLLEAVRDRKLRAVYGDVLGENQTMHARCREQGFAPAATTDPTVIRAVDNVQEREGREVACRLNARAGRPRRENGIPGIRDQTSRVAEGGRRRMDADTL